MVRGKRKLRMLKPLHLSFLIFLTIIFYIVNQAQTKEEVNDFSAVDKIITNAIEDGAFPGSVVLAFKEDGVAYHKSFGHHTYDKKVEVATNTVYDLASLTKVIATTSAVMLCYERNLIELDKPVAFYLPRFSVNRKEKITVKNLLLHNSGLPAWRKFYGREINEDEIIDEILTAKLEYNTGAKTVYSDLGMITLGKIVEKVTGKELDKFCKDEIFDRLKMNSTFFNPPDSVKYRIAPTENDKYWRKRLLIGEVHDEAASLLHGVAGHAGLFSTASDIAKLLYVYINEGKCRKDQIFSKETIDLFTKRFSDMSTRALGWDTKSAVGSSAGSLFGAKSFGHTGFTGTSVWIDPDKKLFVVFLTNRIYPTRENKKLYRVRPKLHNAIVNALN